MLNAGRLRARITFQSATESVDAYGGPTTTWANISSVPTVWAEVMPLSGRELFAAQQVASEITIKVTLRYREDLTTKMRVLHGSTYYDIQHIALSPTREKVELLCKAGVP